VTCYKTNVFDTLMYLRWIWYVWYFRICI